MSVEIFTKERFEEVLSEIAVKTRMSWFRDGIQQGEEHYHFTAKRWDHGDQGLAIEVRSGVGRSGRSAKSGDNSIRCWFSNEFGDPVGNKAKRWITRLPGWEQRLEATITEMSQVAQKVKLCPDCSVMMSVFITKKEGPNKGRWFQKCWDHNHFEWVSDPLQKHKPKAGEAPDCPKCGAYMVERKRRSDGQPFWGCSGFPDCRGTRYDHRKTDLEWKEEFAKRERKQEEEAFRLEHEMEQELLEADVMQRKHDEFMEAYGGTPKPQKPKGFVPSHFQERIFEFVRDDDTPHGVVEALAGSGKTETIVRCLEFTDPGSKVAFLAFNRHIAKELAKRAPRHVKVSTVHSLGFAACRKAWGGNLLVQENKLDKILEQILDKFVYGVLFPTIKRLVSLLKANLMDPTDENLDYLAGRYGIELNGDRETVFEAAKLVLQVSYDERESRIDFDDMIWLPVVADVPMAEFDLIFVDETQDLNKGQIELVLRSIKMGGRIIAVGDRHQSMYGFRGADTDAMLNIIEELAAETMPLSITYRCPKSHVRLVNQTFPNIPLEAAEWADEGIVRDVAPFKLVDEASSGDMVLCRTNAPLVKPAFTLIRAGVKAVIRGRDIGKGLKVMIRKMKADTVVVLVANLTKYKDVEMQKLIVAEKTGQAQALEDKVDTIIALTEGVGTISELEYKIEAVFSDDVEGVVFSSVHRAKGLEADKVFILRPELMPHPLATQPWEQVQERNIQYVAYTRSKRELIFVGGKS